MGRLAGFVVRPQLQVLLARRAFCDPSGAAYLHPVGNPAAYERSLAAEMVHAAACPSHDGGGAATAAQVLSVEGTIGGVTPYINLAPFMDPVPHTVRLETTAAHAHKLLLNFSLRHLPVVDAANNVQGIITRRNLVH